VEVQEERDDLADDLNLNKVGGEPHEVVVKQEEDNEKQEILLIFPGVEEDDNQVSQMDSVDDEDSDSQVDSSSEEDDDSDYQVSTMDSEVDSDNQVDSETEHDEIDEPQDLQKPDSITVPVMETDIGKKRVSSFICKKCFQRFGTPTELEEHHKSAHSKIKRETWPCPLEGCRRVYTYSGLIPKHFKTDHCKPPFNCKDCKQGIKKTLKIVH